MQWMLAPADSQGVRHPELAPRVVNNSWGGEVREDGTVAWETKPQLLYKNHVSDWERGYVDLTAYAGKTIRVMFGVRGAWKSEHATAGWFIDDIALELIRTTTVAKVEDELAITKHASGRTVIDFVPIKDEQISAYRLYRAHDDGPFSRVKERTGADIGKYTVSFYDYPTPQQGTYSYYVTAVAGQGESEPSKILQRTFTVGEKISLFDFESDAQGWTSEPDGKGNVFERGTPSLKAKATYSLTSPSPDLSAYTDVTMYFQQWFNTRGRTGSDEWTTYDDIGHIYVRAN